MKLKPFIFPLTAVAIFTFICVFIFKTARYYQKDTCRKTIEFSIAAQINMKNLKLETVLNKNWKEVASDDRKRFLEYVKDHENEYTECSDYKYLINGKNADGTDLPISARLDNFNSTEIQLGE